MQDNKIDYRKIFQGMMSFFYLRLSWGCLCFLPILILCSPIWIHLLPNDLSNRIGIESIEISWLLGITVFSIAFGFFLRWLAFGILLNKKLIISICAFLTVLLAIFHLVIMLIRTVGNDPLNAIQPGLSTILQLATLVGFLTLIFSKNKS